jgi:O-antigen/teichoic acid export membrane protein
MSNHKIIYNASWIIGCKIAQSLIGLVISMLTARYLGPSNFGIINYAASLATFAVPIVQLGLTNIMVQEMVNNPDKEGEILGTSLLMSVTSAIVCIFGLFAIVSCLNADEKTTIIVCVLYSTMLLFQAMELTQYWFQANYISKYTSIASFCAYVVVAVYKVYLLVSHKSVYWFAVSNSLDYLLIAVSIYIIYRKKGGQSFTISLETAKRLFSKSHYYIVSSMMVVVFAQIDRVMIKNMLGNTDVGLYSAALTCAGLASFVFSALIDSFRPSIFEALKQSRLLFERRMSVLYGVVIYMSLLFCILVTISAPMLIRILYGNEYMPAVNTLRCAVWFTTFSYLGAVRNIWILAENKQKFLWVVNLSGALVNILLNAIFIPYWGIVGAAVASVVTQFFANVIINYIISPIRYSNYLMLCGMNPLFLLSIIRHRGTV